MRYAVIAINDNRSLGNRLQDFAVQEMIMGLDSKSHIETILNTNRKERGETPKQILKNLLRNIEYSEQTKNVRIFNRNPNYGRLNLIALLSFVLPQKRIAFSASYSVSEISQGYASSISKEYETYKAFFQIYYLWKYDIKRYLWLARIK